LKKNGKKRGITMKVIYLLTSASLVLSGCISQQFYVKNGVTLDRYERDGVFCATKATQEVGTNTQIAWDYYAGLYTADTNNELRARNMEICMRDRGYAYVEIPMCTGDQLKKANEKAKQPRNLKNRMKVNSSSCYTVNSDGKPLLYSG
jgi:hypothetical protein